MAFARHIRTVSGLTLLSRSTGLIRDASFSRIFGAGPVMDAFFFALMVPNLFRRLFGEGALSAAFLPEFAQLERSDPQTARRLASFTLASLVAALGGLVLIGEVILFVIDRTADEPNLAVRLMMITLPYMPLVCIVAILGAMLQVLGRFGPTAAAPVLLNGGLIAVTLLLATRLEENRVRHAVLLSATVVVAGVGQVAWSLAALRGAIEGKGEGEGKGWWRRDFRAASESMSRVARRALPMILGLGVLQLNTFIDGLIAGYPTVVGPTIFGIAYPLEKGAISAVTFAQRLYQFPLGVFGIAVATAIFPALARAGGDPEQFGGMLRRGLRLVVFIGLPAGIGLMLVREPLTTVLYQGGTFLAEDTARVGFILLGYAPAVWAYSMTHVLTRAFYARDDATTPVKVAVGVVALNLALNCVLIWTPLREAGLAWSTAACAIVQVCVLLSLLRRRQGVAVDRAVGVSWVRSVVATVVMAGVVLGVGAVMGEGSSWGAAFWLLVATVVGGGVAYLGVALLLKMPELGWVAGRDQ